MKRVVVSVPASSANLGPGFDTLGLALAWRSRVALAQRDGPGILVEISGEGAATLPRSAENLAARAVQRVFRLARRPLEGLCLRLDNQVPLERGLGSSASAVVGGLVAAARYLHLELSREELLALAAELEGHPDNVAPALYGGFTVAWEEEGRIRARRLPPPPLQAVVAIPEGPLATRDARRCLPASVGYRDAVYNLQRVALLVYAVAQGEWELLRDACRDRLHQPYREQLLPGLGEAIEAALSAGAVFGALSGAGSSVLALAQGGAEAVGEALVAALARHGVSARYRVTVPDPAGVQVEEEVGR